ncbi:MAG: patatin-like phospholipase family protein [Vulcanimicrobiota bacterium]
MSFSEAPYVAAVASVLSEEKRQQLAAKKYSDLTDGAGHQYVDLVQEGGVMLGIALVGYTYVLEECGIRFWSLGGASAGAINALMLAAFRRPGESTSAKLIKVLAEMRPKRFVDGGEHVARVIQAALQGTLGGKVYWEDVINHNLIDIIKDAKEEGIVALLNEDFEQAWKHFGLNPGEEFLKWATQVLESAGIRSWSGLEADLGKLPEGLKIREKPANPPAPSLGLVVGDITTESRIEFPRMAALFWEKPGEVNPAKFVRASMSVPGFFYPYIIDGLPKNQEANWKEWTGYGEARPGEDAPIFPTRALLVDGGLVSNFPIDIFHVEGKVPDWPTFGAKLSSSRIRPNETRTMPNFVAHNVDTARHLMDYTFLHKHPEFQYLVGHIRTGDFQAFDFEMPEASRVELFRLGAKAAVDFLEGFQWGEYQKLRARLAALPEPAISAP